MSKVYNNKDHDEYKEDEDDYEYELSEEEDILSDDDEEDIEYEEDTNDDTNEDTNENIKEDEDIDEVNNLKEDVEDNIEDKKIFKEKKKKKKKSHYFVHHIRKISKEICPKRDITFEAKKILNELTILTCKILTSKVNYIIKSNNKKTINETDIEIAVKLIFIGQLSQKCVDEGYKSLKNYLICRIDDDSKGKSRNEKADILLPPSVMVKFLKTTGMYITGNSPVFMAGVIEYFISQIIELSNNVSLNKNVRITVDDIENGVKMDKELTNYFVSNNIYLSGSSIIPYTHPLFRNKINDTKYNKHIQEYTENIFPKTCIESKFKNYINLVYPDIRYQKDCFDYFQTYLEKWMVELLKHSNNITLYSKKSRVTENDIEIALSIMEGRSPIFFDERKNNINVNDTININDTINFEEDEE